jgi:hypothetical protein
VTTSRRITAVMRNLAPRPVRLATRARPNGDFSVFMPSATAGHMGLPEDRGRTWLGDYLTRYLGEPVHVAGVKTGPPDVRGRTVMVTVRPGVCRGPECPPV